jgi:hypothetical protein
MAKTIATILGVVFILVGLVGFVSHDFLGTHLSTIHNIIHLVSGAISLYLGLMGTLSAARLFGFVFGAVYLLLGVVGFLLGSGDGRLFTVIEGSLVLGTMDHVVHILLGLVYLIGAFLTGAAVSPTSANAD